MKSVGPESEARISSINEATAQYTKEGIARNVRNNWGLYVASEKLSLAWQNRLGMNDYLGIDALTADKRLIEKFGEDYSLYKKQVPALNPVFGLVKLISRKAKQTEAVNLNDYLPHFLFKVANLT